MNLWMFLSIGVVFVSVMGMYNLYLEHKKSMKKLEIEALKYKYESGYLEDEKSQQLESRNGAFDDIIIGSGQEQTSKASRY